MERHRQFDLSDESDESIRNALSQVEVPVDLASRIKASVRVSRRASIDAQSSAEAGPTLARSAGSIAEEGPPVRATWMNRRMFVGGAAAVAGIGLWGSFYLQTRPFDQAWLAQLSLSVLDEIESSTASWSEVSTKHRQRLETVRPYLTNIFARGVREISPRKHVVRASVFRLDVADGRGLFLLEMNLTRIVAELPGTFESLPTYNQVWSMAAMQERDQVFVLAGACSSADLMNNVRGLRQA